jgi:ribosomal protein S18 acetylase RimI-like enzyme
MGSLSPNSVSYLFTEQDPSAAVALGRAFVDDPALGALIPGIEEPAERVDRFIRFFAAVMRLMRRFGHPIFGIVDGGKVAGTAIVEGSLQPTPVATVMSGLIDLPRFVGALGFEGTLRAIRLMDALARNHPREAHIYLNFLGVDPAFQRRHYGIAILDYLRDLARIRSDVIGVYLETATPANVPYYERAGYEVLSEIRPLGVKMWRMLQRRAA